MTRHIYGDEDFTSQRETHPWKESDTLFPDPFGRFPIERAGCRQAKKKPTRERLADSVWIKTDNGWYRREDEA